MRNRFYFSLNECKLTNNHIVEAVTIQVRGSQTVAKVGADLPAAGQVVDVGEVGAVEDHLITAIIRAFIYLRQRVRLSKYVTSKCLI